MFITVSVANHSGVDLSGLSDTPARLSYRWSDSNEEPLRSDLWCPCKVGQHRTYNVAVRVPTDLGPRQLVPAIVIEGVTWIHDAITTPVTINIVAADTPLKATLEQFESKEYSQNGEDGILRELILRLGTSERFIVEIGAGAGTENNSIMWIEHYGWSGLLIEGDQIEAERLKSRFACNAAVKVVSRHIDVDSLVGELRRNDVPIGFDILSIDIDGNDYWLWEAAAPWRPRIVTVEYNASLGPSDDWVMPYDPDHRWDGSDRFGASISALARLGISIGYSLIGSDRTGVNAFFIRDDLLPVCGFDRIAPNAAHRRLTSASSWVPRGGSAALKSCYTDEYFVQNCGGFQFVGNNDPLRIEDPRFRAVLSPAEMRPPGKALDLGCGRGEITGYLLARHWEVDAIDYSASAIALTRQYLENCGLIDRPVSIIQSDVNSIALTNSSYDIAFAIDVVEHLSRVEVDMLFDRVRRALKPNGTFIVHTFPNAWYYRFGWPRIRAESAARGVELPLDPRTDFERLMHINEQSPKDLARALARYFPFCELWLGSPIRPFDVPLRKARRADLRGLPDLFAVASCSPFEDPTTSPLFSCTPFSDSDVAGIALSIVAEPQGVDKNYCKVRIEIINKSLRTLSSFGSAPIFLSYRLLDSEGGILCIEGRRTPLLPPVTPGMVVERDVVIDLGDSRARSAQVTFVQEGVRWFSEQCSATLLLSGRGLEAAHPMQAPPSTATAL